MTVSPFSNASINPTLTAPQFAGRGRGRRLLATAAALAALGTATAGCASDGDQREEVVTCAAQLNDTVGDAFNRTGLERTFVEGRCEDGEFKDDVIISMPETDPDWREHTRTEGWASDDPHRGCAEEVAAFRQMAEDRGMPRLVIRGECDDDGKVDFDADQLVIFPTPEGNEINTSLVNTMARGRCEGHEADKDFQLDELIGMPEPTGWQDAGVEDKRNAEGTYAECARGLRSDRTAFEEEGMPNILIRGTCDGDGKFEYESFREFEYTNTSGAQVTQEGSAESDRTGDYVQFMSDDNLFRMAQWMVYDPQNPESGETSGVYFVYYPVSRGYYSYGGVR